MSADTRTVIGRFENYEVSAERLDLRIGRAKLFEVVGRPHLLYKEFGKPRHGQREVDRLESLAVDGRESFQEGASPDAMRNIAWPRDFVPGGTTLVEGVVVPRAEERFFMLGQAVLVTRSLTVMWQPAHTVPARARLTLMRQLAEAFEFLRGKNLVHGDISANNVLWCPPPRAAVLLVDCDGLRHPSEPGGQGTKHWRDPRVANEEIKSPDMYSDWYVLAMAIWRMAALPPQGQAPARRDGAIVLPPEFPLRLGELLRRALEDPRKVEDRPEPGEWAEALAAVAKSRSQCQELDVLVGLQPAPEPQPRPVEPEPPRVDPADLRVPPPPPREPRRPPPAGRRPQPKKRSPRPAPRRRPLTLRALASATALAVIGLLLSGWFSPNGQLTPQERAERSVARWARGNLGPGIEAACPGSSSLHADTSYSCKVESHTGAVARVWVAINGNRDIHRHLGIQRFRKRSIVATLRRRYRRRARHGAPGLTAISCPESIPARTGAQITCRCTFSDDGTEAIRITLRSHRGQFTWRSQSGSGGRGAMLRRHPVAGSAQQ